MKYANGSNGASDGGGKKKKRVRIVPHPSLFRKVGQINSTVGASTGDLLDNPIDAARGQKLRVDFTLTKDAVTMMSNDPGMTASQMVDAMTMGISSKGLDELGFNGMGLKSSGAFLGEETWLISGRLADRRATAIVVNQAELEREGTWEVTQEEVEKPMRHGTVVQVRRLKVKMDQKAVEETIAYIGRVFRRFLESGQLTVTVNDTEVKPFRFDLDTDCTKKEFAIKLSGDLKVTGWVGRQKKRSNLGRYGFDLLRNDRVIKIDDKIGLRRHPSVANIVGELNLDPRIPVTVTKTDVARGSELWEELSTKLTRIVREHVKASAGKYRPRKKPTPKPAKPTVRVTPGPETRPTDEPRPDGEFSAIIGGHRVRHVFRALTANDPYATSEMSPDGSEMVVITNMEHPGLRDLMKPAALARQHMVEQIAIRLYGNLTAAAFVMEKSRLLAQFRAIKTEEVNQ